MRELIHFSREPEISDLARYKQKYVAFVNVSDTPGPFFSEEKSFWLPINELGDWGYAPFFVAAKVFDKFRSLGPICCFCHAGVCRSPSVTYALLHAEGLSDEEIVAQLPKHMQASASGLLGIQDTFRRNVERGHIPKDIIDFLICRKGNETYSMIGLLAKINSPALYTQYYKERYTNENFYGFGMNI